MTPTEIRDAYKTGMITAEEADALLPKPTHYDIIDCHSSRKVGEAATLRAATRSCDRRDRQYGAVRYIHRAIYAA